jgi:hypothetical protein
MTTPAASETEERDLAVRNLLRQKRVGRAEQRELAVRMASLNPSFQMWRNDVG